MPLSQFSRGTPVSQAARPASEGRRARAEAAGVDALVALYEQGANVRKVQLAVGDDTDLARVALQLEGQRPKPRTTLLDWLHQRLPTAP